MAINWNAETNNVVFGAGRLFWTPEDANGALESGELYIGDTPGFGLDVSSDVATVESSDGPTPEVIATSTSSMSRTFEFDAIDISTGNLARFIVANESTVTQTAVQVVDESITMATGRYYQLGASVANPSGVYGGISALAITDKVEGTDYEVDMATARVKSLTIEGAALCTYTPIANSRTRITASDEGDQYGALRYISDNARGTNSTMFVPRCLLQGNGQAELKSRTNHIKLSFKATAEKREGFAVMYIDGRPNS